MHFPPEFAGWKRNLPFGQQVVYHDVGAHGRERRCLAALGGIASFAIAVQTGRLHFIAHQPTEAAPSSLFKSGTTPAQNAANKITGGPLCFNRTDIPMGGMPALGWSRRKVICAPR
jgi:hypothetical protein